LTEPWQDPQELAALLVRFRRLHPARVLEVGTARGGTLRAWLANLPRGGVVVSVDLPWEGEDWRETFARWVPEGVTLHCMPGNSRAPEIRAAVERLVGSVDFLFLDGDHSYAGVRQDYEAYGRIVRPGGLIAFHDALRSPFHPEIEVWRVWQEIRASGARTEEIVARATAGGGIGLVHC
jgi:predicted O-methyltransferase YrrM